MGGIFFFLVGPYEEFELARADERARKQGYNSTAFDGS